MIDGVVITKSRAVTDNELEIELSQERRTSRSESPTTERKVSEADNTLPDEDGTDNADTAAASHVPIKPCSVCKVEIPDEICTFKNCEPCCMNRERPCKPHLNKNELTTKEHQDQYSTTKATRKATRKATTRKATTSKATTRKATTRTTTGARRTSRHGRTGFRYNAETREAKTNK